MQRCESSLERKTLGVEETARVLGISPFLARKLVKNGTIPHIRLGERRILIPVAAIDELLKNGIQQ